MLIPLIPSSFVRNWAYPHQDTVLPNERWPIRDDERTLHDYKPSDAYAEDLNVQRHFGKQWDFTKSFQINFNQS